MVELTLDLNIEQFLKLRPEEYIDEAAPIAFLFGKMWGELMELRQDKARFDRIEELGVGIEPPIGVTGWQLNGLAVGGTVELEAVSVVSLRDAIDAYLCLYDEQAAAAQLPPPTILDDTNGDLPDE